MMFTLSVASVLTFILSLSPPVSALCLPCQAAFRRHNFLQHWTLRSRDSGAASIHILNPSYRSVWFNGELQLVTWYVVSPSVLAVCLSVEMTGTLQK